MAAFGEDDWDSIVNLDAQVHEQGYNDGFKDSSDSGMLQAGMRGGFLKGLAFGLEAGFIEKSCRLLVEPKLSDLDSSNRTDRRIAEVSAKAEDILNAHRKDTANGIDYEEEIRHLRSLHRQLGTPLGVFPPKMEVTTTKKVSSDW